MLLFCASCVQSAPARFPKRRRAVQGGSDMSLRFGCDLSLSGLNAGAFYVSRWTCGRKSTAKRHSCHDARVSEHYQNKAKQGYSSHLSAILRTHRRFRMLPSRRALSSFQPRLPCRFFHQHLLRSRRSRSHLPLRIRTGSLLHQLLSVLFNLLELASLLVLVRNFCCTRITLDRKIHIVFQLFRLTCWLHTSIATLIRSVIWTARSRS